MLANPSDIYMQAPQDYIDAKRERLAMTRGLRPRKANGRQWGTWQLLGRGLRDRLHGHDKAFDMNAVHRSEQLEYTCNLNQTNGYMPASKNLPCLLRGSVLWSFKRRRTYEVLETAEVMGFGPTWVSPEDRDGMVSDSAPEPAVKSSVAHPQLSQCDISDERIPLLDAMLTGKLSSDDRDLRLAIANSMSTHVCGAVQLFVLACTVPHNP